jgi:hypothetical protein
MVFVRSIKVAPVSSNFLLKELDLSPHRQVAGFFFAFPLAAFPHLRANPHSAVLAAQNHAALQND